MQYLRGSLMSLVMTVVKTCVIVLLAMGLCIATTTHNNLFRKNENNSKLNGSMPGCLSGISYEDANCNGATDLSETGIAGVQVNIYDCDNALMGSALTDGGGLWELCGLTDSELYRIEYILTDSLDGLYNPSHQGSGNGTDVQFSAPDNFVNLGLVNPANYCEDGAMLITPCYFAGDNTGTEDILLTWDYDNTGTAGNVTTLSMANQTGSLWGLAYDAQSTSLFASSVLKRHSGLYNGAMGDGLDVIFEVDPFSGTSLSLIHI